MKYLFPFYLTLLLSINLSAQNFVNQVLVLNEAIIVMDPLNC